MPRSRETFSAPVATHPCGWIEALESRRLMAAVNSTPLHVLVDYTYDTANFFNTQAKRDLMQAAANFAMADLGDSLSSIIPSGDNGWRAVFDHPATGAEQRVSNLSVPADTLLVFVGSRHLSDAVAIGGPGGYTATGSSSWLDRVGSRGQDNVRGQTASDFGPWGGSITFDPAPEGDWYFGSDAASIGADANDFYSVAIHETLHVLGFGTSDSFSRYVVNGKFTGPAAESAYDGSGAIPLSGERSHWADGTTDGGQEVAMDPTISAGQRKLPTSLDYAALDDIGWQLPITARLNSTGPFVRDAGTAELVIEYRQYHDIPDSRIGQAAVTVTGPGGFSTQATLVRVEPATDLRMRQAVYSFTAPGGTWDSGDSGQYAVQLTGTVTDNFANTSGTGQIDVFSAQVEGPPSAALNAPMVTEFGGATASLVVTYSDDAAVDAQTINAVDLTITRADGLQLAMVGEPVLSPAMAATPIVATYTVAAPGGTWDPADNGLYTVALNGNEVSDLLGGFAAGGTLGQLQVAVGLIDFGGKTFATYTDATGDTVTISLKGPGSGSVALSGNQPADAQLITLSGTTAQSSLTIKAGGGGTSIGGISTDGAIKLINARTSDLLGNLQAPGSVGKIQLRNAANGTWSLGAGQTAAITLGDATDVSIEAAGAIKSIAANNWLDSNDSGEHVSSPSVASLSVRGNLTTDINAGTIGKVSIAGILANSTVRAAGSITSLTAGSVSNSAVLAGFASTPAGLPVLGDFADPAAQIRSISVRSRASGSFAGSIVSAPVVRKASLGVAASNNGGTPFGLIADQIGSVSGISDAGGAYRFAKVFDPQDLLVVGDFIVRAL